MFVSWVPLRLETSPGEMAAASPVEAAEDSVVEEADAGADVVSNKDGAAATAIAAMNIRTREVSFSIPGVSSRDVVHLTRNVVKCPERWPGRVYVPTISSRLVDQDFSLAWAESKDGPADYGRGLGHHTTELARHAVKGRSGEFRASHLWPYGPRIHCSPQAASSYSWISPPSLSRRRTCRARGDTDCEGVLGARGGRLCAAGMPWESPWCGRWQL